MPDQSDEAVGVSMHSEPYLKYHLRPRKRFSRRITEAMLPSAEEIVAETQQLPNIEEIEKVRAQHMKQSGAQMSFACVRVMHRICRAYRIQPYLPDCALVGHMLGGARYV